jgi:hypothetical protein
MPSRSRRTRRASFALNFPPSPIRGSRECRVRAAPAVSCAKLCEKTHTSIQVQRKHSGIPHAIVLRLISRSPRRRIRLVTVAAGLMAIQSGRIELATGSLTPATGARTTRFCRTHQRRSSCAPVDRSRETRPATPFRADAAASTASPPAFVTIAIRPSCRERTGRAGSADLPDGTSGIFSLEGLTGFC